MKKILIFLFLLVSISGYSQLNLPFGVKVLNPKPLDAKYFNIAGTAYTNTAQVISQLTSGLRYDGLTVSVAGTEYWFYGGIGDGDLVVKTSGGITIGSTAITGGTSGRLLTSGATVGELTLGTGVSTWLGTPSWANFNSAITGTAPFPTNTAANNEIPKSDGTNIIPSGIFSSSLGNIQLGTGLTGATRTVKATGSASIVDLVLDTKGTTGAIIFKINGNNYGEGIGKQSGFIAIGDNAGNSATNNTDATFIGSYAGASSSNTYQSNFFGAYVGQAANGSHDSNFFGTGAGSSTNAPYSNFFGVNAGQNTNAQYSNFFGYAAGKNATSAQTSNFFGTSAGENASGASASNFFGPGAGTNATNAVSSNFFGNSAGTGASNASYSNFYGHRAGLSFTGNNLGSNNTIIGTNVSLPDATANSINLGGVLFGSNTYSTTTGNPSISATSTGVIGIGILPVSTATLTLRAGTTAIASLGIPHGAAPTTPVNGNFWTTTAGLFGRINGTTVAYGSGTVTSVTSANADATVANTTTTPVITIVNSPKVGGITITGTPSVGQIPTATSGTAATWQTPASGFADPMTTRGDIIIRNAANATARLGVGANTYVLTSNGTDVAWAAPSGGYDSTIMATQYNIALKFKTVSAGTYTILEGDKGYQITFTSACTVTLPNGLSNGHWFTVWNTSGGTLTFGATTTLNTEGGATTITSNYRGAYFQHIGSNVWEGTGLGSGGGGGGSGTVTNVSVVTANGFAGTVATSTTTPAITLTTSITGLLKGNGTAISAASAGTDYLTPTGSAAGLTSFPTLNQNTTGSAATLTTSRTIGITTGDVTSAGSSFNGSANNTNALTIANDAVTYAKIQNVSAASKLLGRGSASGSGDTEEITIGSGLTMSGTTLSATGGGSGTVTSVTSANADATVATTTTTPVITIVQTPALRSATTTVDVSAATAPTSGQVLTATGGTAATWQTPSGGGISGLTTNELVYGNSATTIASLPVATYPSLTELSYVKGLTSSAQTQLGTKWSLASGGTLTGVNTITSNAVNQLNYVGTWTGTATNQYHHSIAPTLTFSNNVAHVNAVAQIGGTLTAGVNSQVLRGLVINPTYAYGAFGRASYSQLGLDIRDSNGNGFKFYTDAFTNTNNSFQIVNPSGVTTGEMVVDASGFSITSNAGKSLQIGSGSNFRMLLSGSRVVELASGVGGGRTLFGPAFSTLATTSTATQRSANASFASQGNGWNGAAAVTTYLFDTWDASTATNLLFTSDRRYWNGTTHTDIWRVSSLGRMFLGGITDPLATLHLAAGTTSIAPLLVASGTNLTTPVNGAIENDGTHLYYTASGVRNQLDQQGIKASATQAATETLVVSYGNLTSSSSASSTIYTDTYYSNSTVLIADFTVYAIKSDGSASAVGKVTGRYRKNSSGTFSVDNAGTAIISDVAVLASLVPEITGNSPKLLTTMGVASGTYRVSFTAVISYSNY